MTLPAYEAHDVPVIGSLAIRPDGHVVLAGDMELTPDEFDRFLIDRVHSIVMDPACAPDVARQLAVTAYVAKKKPTTHYSIDEWLEMFAKGGLAEGNSDPSQPITLYRGCHPRFKNNISWTNSRRLAEEFAKQWKVSAVFRLETTIPEIIWTTSGWTAEKEREMGWAPEQSAEFIVDARHRKVVMVPGTFTKRPCGYDAL